MTIRLTVRNKAAKELEDEKLHGGCQVNGPKVAKFPLIARQKIGD